MEISDIGKERNHRKRTPDLSTLVYGKVPPQAREIEEAILGSIMLESKAFNAAAEILTAECFYVDSHQRIFKAFQQLKADYSPIDILTTIEQCRKNEELEVIGGPYAISRLTNSVVSSANIDTHCKIVFQKHLQREMIRMAGEIIGDAYEDKTDVFELIEKTALTINGLQLNNSGKDYTIFLEHGEAVLAKIEQVRKTGEVLTGAPCGITDIDRVTMGFQPTDLIIIAARPAVGKSAVAANFARGAASHGLKPTKVGVFSLEMSAAQWVQRIMSADSEIDGYDMKRGRVSDSGMVELQRSVYERSYRDRIFFDDTAGLSINQLKAKARKMVLKEGVGLIIVDYLQLATASISKGNREQEISSISRDLKQLAKELKVPVIALSQLNRQADGKEPALRDLRESGAIEQDADIVIFLMPVDESGTSEDPMLQNAILTKFAKFRDGALDNIPLRYVKSIQKIFSDEFDYERYMNGHPPNMKPVSALPIPDRPAPRNYTEPATHDDIEEIESKPF